MSLGSCPAGRRVTWSNVSQMTVLDLDSIYYANPVRMSAHSLNWIR